MADQQGTAAASGQLRRMASAPDASTSLALVHAIDTAPRRTILI
jgi:hypothetical protein